MEHEHSHDQDTEQAQTTRRGFFKLAVGAMAFLGGLVIGVPFLGSLVSPVLRRKQGWSRVAEMGSLPTGQPLEVKFSARTEDAYHSADVLYSVWVVKHAADRATVFSPVCTHLGCHFIWKQDRGNFACPCHASLFSIEGKVLYGPAPRSLDALQHRIDDGVLFVQWERFRTGTPAKIPI